VPVNGQSALLNEQTSAVPKCALPNEQTNAVPNEQTSAVPKHQH
jgi:hypothetical protein